MRGSSGRPVAPPPWALARVPGLGGGGCARSIRRLAGGSVNEVFRVQTAVGDFVVRLNGPAWRRPGVDRHRELALHRAAAAAGLAPAIVDADPDRDGLLITAYEAGRVWTEADYVNSASIRRLGERLQLLHALPSPSVRGFDPWEIAQDYLRTIRADSEPVDVPAEPLRQLEAACAAIRADAAPASIAHGDLTQSNLLDGRRLWLLDWEYAQRSDAFMDLACVLAYYPQSLPLAAELAAAAGLRLDRTILAPRVYIYRALTWLWHLARRDRVAPPEPGEGIAAVGTVHGGQRPAN